MNFRLYNRQLPKLDLHRSVKLFARKDHQDSTAPMVKEDHQDKLVDQDSLAGME